MLCSQNMSMNADLLCAQRIIEVDYILDCCMKLHLDCDTYESCGSDDVIMRTSCNHSGQSFPIILFKLCLLPQTWTRIH